MAILGNTVSISFDNGFVAAGQIEQAEGLARSVAVLDATPLNLANGKHKQKIFSKRVEHDAFALTYFFDPSQTAALPTLGAEVEITVLYPGGTAELTGKGSIVASNSGDLVGDELVMATCAFQFNGGADAVDNPVIQGT